MPRRPVAVAAGFGVKKHNEGPEEWRRKHQPEVQQRTTVGFWGSGGKRDDEGVAKFRVSWRLAPREPILNSAMGVRLCEIGGYIERLVKRLGTKIEVWYQWDGESPEPRDAGQIYLVDVRPKKAATESDDNEEE